MMKLNCEGNKKRTLVLITSAKIKYRASRLNPGFIKHEACKLNIRKISDKMIIAPMELVPKRV